MPSRSGVASRDSIITPALRRPAVDPICEVSSGLEIWGLYKEHQVCRSAAAKNAKQIFAAVTIRRKPFMVAVIEKGAVDNRNWKEMNQR
jgi:hypothetical protein